jgi:hypothetical protein
MVVKRMIAEEARHGVMTGLLARSQHLTRSAAEALPAQKDLTRSNI